MKNEVKTMAELIAKQLTEEKHKTYERNTANITNSKSLQQYYIE